jgi:hypothetical protein
VSGLWESLLAPTLHFHFVKNLCMELGLGIVVVGASHQHGGINNSNLMLNLEGVPKLTHETPIKGEAM